MYVDRFPLVIEYLIQKELVIKIQYEYFLYVILHLNQSMLLFLHCNLRYALYEQNMYIKNKLLISILDILIDNCY